jgi:uncharacterized protein YgiM (DUF1202 family)
MNGSAHDDPGYPRHKIDRVVIHHNSTTNYKVALNTWLKGGKMTSAHYEITPTQIIGCVDETRSAWHAGNKLMNQRSIGLEHVNSTGAPNWEVAEATLKLSAKLCADICKRYGIPIDSAHIVPHNSIVATDCPGGISMSHYIELVREAAGQKVPSTGSATTTPEAKPTGKGGTYTFKATTNVRTSPSTSAAVVAQYKAGQTVSYSSTVQAEGYTWMVYTGASGKTRYVAQTNGTEGSNPTASSTSGRVAQSGTWRARTTVNVRAAASTSSAVVATYKKGQTVKYDSYIDAEGIRWCSYIGGSGKRRYVARRNLKTGYLYADAY